MACNNQATERCTHEGYLLVERRPGAWLLKRRKISKGSLFRLQSCYKITTTHNKNRLAALEAQDEAINMDHNRTCKKYEASLALLARSHAWASDVESAEHACECCGGRALHGCQHGASFSCTFRRMRCSGPFNARTNVCSARSDV